MSTAQIKAISTGLFFLFIFLSGFWLSRSGKPYNLGIFNIHKLIGLAAGIFLIVTVSRIHKTTPFTPLAIAILVITVLIFISLVAAGGLLSIEATGGLSNASQMMLSLIATIHKTFPYLAVISTAATLYLLFRKM
jgi:hypothetical protein